MVATSQPLAVLVGIEILREGGTAADAAIAVNAALGLMEPMSCGLGGDLFAIYWEAKSRKLYGLNGSGRSPYKLNRGVFAERGMERIPIRGPLSWSVPGCVDGWFTLHERFCSLPMSKLLAPAIRYAEAGFPVSPIIAAAWKRAESILSEDAGAAATYLPTGRAPRPGELFRNPDLAWVLRMIEEGGKHIFYQGEVAERIVAASQKLCGYLTMEDFTSHTSIWTDPLSVPYRGYDVWELPPNSQGIAVLEMLQILNDFDLTTLGHNSAELLHLLIEAKKLAYEDRARLYADPDFYAAPLDRFVSGAYADQQRQRIDLNHASLELPLDDHRLRPADTVYLTVVDDKRNAASFIQSNYMGFGSGIVPTGLGFPLQNRGCLFCLDPHHPNRLEPHKRPFHTIIPGFVTRDERPLFSFGVMGGDMQPQGQVQVLVNLIDFEMDPQAAGDALRFRHDGSSAPTGEVMHDGGTVFLEPGFPNTTADGLRRKRHHVEHRPGGYGGYQGIWIDPDTDILHGGSDPRKDGCAIGY
jgi:gamma-glutamyltranspeptidase/glutathione hydrolase